jgi:hypothetical protein
LPEEHLAVEENIMVVVAVLEVIVLRLFQIWL